jgi:hypothetical protein
MTARDSHRFNSDLLLHPEDQALARELYPQISYALDDETLRARFAAIDAVANATKRRSRIWGGWAVALVTLALLGASAEHLYGRLSHAAWVAGGAAACGIIGSLIGWHGLLYANNKRLWLESRLLTETMRLFHFRTLLMLSDQILAGDRATYLARRRALFLAFEADIIADPAAVLDNLLAIDTDEDGLSVPIPETLPEGDPAIAAQFIDAYRRLRLQHQLNYARYKLRMDWKLFSAFPRQQAYWLGSFALACVLGTVVAHLILVGLALFPYALFPHETQPLLPVAGVWFAILALAFRTLEEGLQPSIEAERYRHYQAAVKGASDRFEAAETLRGKLLAAQSLERTSADEMRIFLRSSSEARFVM